jgi:hypothetical protein
MLLYLPSVLVIALQIFCIVHAIRNGRERWIFLILIFPLIGSIVYLVMEVRIGREGRKVAAQVVNAITPSRRLEELRAQLEHCDTVENRMALAEESTAHGLHDEAIQLYEGCRHGPFKDDPEVLIRLARAYMASKAYEKVRDTLEHLFRTTPRFKTPEHRLLLARAFEQLGATDDALAEYEAISGRVVGDEARCRHAVLLRKLGRNDEARKIFAKILSDARQSPGHYRRANRDWIDVAAQYAKE